MGIKRTVTFLLFNIHEKIYSPRSIKSFFLIFVVKIMDTLLGYWIKTIIFKFASIDIHTTVKSETKEIGREITLDNHKLD